MEKMFEITKQLVKRLYCDKCDGVEMQRSKTPTIALAPGQPTRYTYVCPVCRATHVSTNVYPTMFTDMVELIMPDDNPPVKEVKME